MRLLSSILRRSPLLQRWRFAVYFVPYTVLTRLLRVRVRPQRILFLSDSRSDFSGNFGFLRDELLVQASDADIIGVLKPRRDAARPFRDQLRLPWLMATAQTIVLDDFYPIVYPVRIRPETKLVQVWHAAGAFKRVGWARAGLPGGPTPGSIIHKNYTDATVSSEGIRAEYAESYGIAVDRVHALGVPRTDVFFDAGEVRRADIAVRERYGIAPETKIVMFAPTFRGNGQLSAHFDYDSVDWDGLAEQLGDGWAVFVKMHPFVPPLTTARPTLRRIVDVSADREITELLMASDVLVTDYSSTIFEFALLRRPMVFFCPDLEEYTAGRDFYRPFEQYVTGPLVQDAGELADAIRSAEVGERLDEFLREFMDACDGHSSERIVREVLLRARRGAS